MNKQLLLIVFFFVSYASLSQIVIKGKVYDINYKELPYVSIGIPDANVGTYSFEDGVFELELKNFNKTDIIEFSHIGYKTKAITIARLVSANNIKVNLEISEERLDEVLIRDFKQYNKIIGLIKKNSSSSINIGKPSNGSEVAILLTNQSYPYSIEEINLNVYAQNLDNYSIRVKFYDVDESTNLPNKIISKQNITETFTIDKGNLSFYPNEPVIIDKPIFISFEWLISKENALKIRNSYQIKNQDILANYKSNLCDKCSRVIENNKRINFYDAAGKSKDILRLGKKDKNRIKLLEKSLPKLAFQTTKANYPTFYRYATFGKWYRYPQSLIASIKISE